MTALHLQNGCVVLTAWAEPASGPGWSNTPIWVLVRGGRAGGDFGGLRVECIQPEDQTPEMEALYVISSAAHGSMVRAVERAMKGAAE